MGVFHFKRFDVVNEQSSMKVNTDGVILGAAVTLRDDDRRVLDVGTGTGTVALMIAQRLEGAPSSITGIDIDAPSAAEAASNFAASPWADKLRAIHVPLREYEADEQLDLVVSNPPYFDNSLQAPDERRNVARHTEVGDSLSYRELAEFAGRRLSDTGRLALILPADQEKPLLRCLRSYGLHPFRVLYVRTTPRKAPARIVVEASRIRPDSMELDTLTIQEGGEYTAAYLALTHDFYLFA